MSKQPQLTPEQLTDLLNYVLGLPLRSLLSQKIVRDRIPVVVVRTWDKNYRQERVERWCDGVLVAYQVIPRPAWWRYAGQGTMPPWITRWAG